MYHFCRGLQEWRERGGIELYVHAAHVCGRCSSDLGGVSGELCAVAECCYHTGRLDIGGVGARCFAGTNHT